VTGARARAFLAHAAGLAAGSLAVAAILFLLGTVAGHPPAWALGALAVFLAAVSAHLVRLRLSGSPWRVPASWGRIGRIPYAAVFGFTLGTGLLNALSSPAFFLVLAWPLAAGGWGSVYPVFLAFALGRALPTGTMTLMSGGGSAAAISRFRLAASYLFIVESVVLMALAVIWFWRLRSPRYGGAPRSWCRDELELCT
jgi:hypothetical protein